MRDVSPARPAHCHHKGHFTSTGCAEEPTYLAADEVTAVLVHQFLQVAQVHGRELRECQLLLGRLGLGVWLVEVRQQDWQQVVRVITVTQKDCV